jgi:Mrp family chromosome partitioning ATPase
MSLELGFTGGPTTAPEEAAGPYWRAFTRHWRLVILVALLAVGAAVFTASRLARNYEASASVLVTPLPGTDPDFVGTGAIIDSNDPARTVQTAAAVIQSPQAAAAAARTLPGWDPQRVQAAVGVTPRGQSDVLAVTATGSTAEGAAQLANAYARASVAARAAVVQANVARELRVLRARLPPQPANAPSTLQQQTLAARINQLQSVRDAGGDPSLSVLAAAQLPSSPTGAPKWLIVLLAGLAGVALGCVAALAIEYFSRRVRDANDVRSVFPAPILAGIPKVRRARGPLSPLTLPPQAFEQLRLLRAQLVGNESRRVIMVTSADAGDGKTTVAAGLACALGEGNQDVILFDLDVIKPDAAQVLLASALDNGRPEVIQGQSAQRKPRAKGQARVRGRPRANAPLSDLLVPVAGVPRLKVLPAPQGDMADLESLIVRLPALLDEAAELADWVVLDTAPVGEVSYSLRIAPEADAVVVVVRPRHTDRSRLMLARDRLLRAHANLVGTVLVGQSVGKLSSTYYGYATANHKSPAARLWQGIPGVGRSNDRP